MKKFDELLEDLEKLQKAEPPIDPTDEKESVNAAESDDEGKSEIKEPDEQKIDAGDLNKSLTLADGTEIEVKDAAPLIKSLSDQVQELQGHIDIQTEAFGKVLQVQTDLVKSLHAEVQTEIEALRGEGRGRKSVVVSLAERQATGVAEPQELSREQVMAKCLTAQKAGELTALDVSVAEASLNRGIELPARVSAAIG